MKRFLTICLISSLCLSAMAQQRTLQVTVSNPTSVAKTDAPVVIRFSEVKKLKFAVASASVKSMTSMQTARTTNWLLSSILQPMKQKLSMSLSVQMPKSQGSWRGLPKHALMPICN